MSEDTHPAPAGLQPGGRLAGYLLEEEIGRGGMAVVYRAYDDRLERRVALKVIAPELARDEAFRARFIRESRAAAAVEHPHIIPVFDAGETAGVLYLAMRYVPGGDVRLLLDRAAPLPVARACGLIAQVASALDAAHARGLVHRDVKPTNMLLDLSLAGSQPDHVYLSDFGLAKPAAATPGLTIAGQFPGTLAYVAPEQIQGRDTDGRADQYSLACAGFEMLSGAPPFPRANPMAVLSAQLTEPPPSLAARRPELPAAVDEVMGRALAKAPADRYPGCLDFAEALLAACGAGPGAAALAAGTRPGTPAASGPASGTLPLSFPAPGDSAPGAQQPGAPGPGAPEPGTRTLEVAGRAGPDQTVPGWWADLSSPEPATGAGRQPGGGRYPPGTYGRGPYAPAPPAAHRQRWLALLAGLAVLLVAAAIAVILLRPARQAATARHSPAPAAAHRATTPATARPTTAAPPGPRGPAATVRAYVAAINSHDYARAWDLGGKNTGSTYPAFVSGFQGTAHDTLSIVAVSGNTVTARISARQTDGTVRVYQGTYQVRHGVITGFHVTRIS